MNTTRVAALFLLALSSMAQTLPRPAGPYFEPLPDWQYKAGIAPRGIVIAPGDTIIPQIANSGTPQDGRWLCCGFGRRPIDERGRCARRGGDSSGGQRAGFLVHRSGVPRRRYVRLRGVGALRCGWEGRFSAVALEMDPGNRIFITLPVVPVPEMPDQA